MKHQVTLQFEPADWSVGITSEDFAGWEDDSPFWCRMSEYGHTFEDTKFEWFLSETGDEVKAPPSHKFMEKLIWNFAVEYYNSFCSDGEDES